MMRCGWWSQCGWKVVEHCGDVRVGLCNDVASFRRDHDSCAERTSRGVFNSLEETSWDTGGTLDSWSIVELAVIVGRAVLYPVA